MAFSDRQRTHLRLTIGLGHPSRHRDEAAFFARFVVQLNFALRPCHLVLPLYHLDVKLATDICCSLPDDFEATCIRAIDDGSSIDEDTILKANAFDCLPYAGHNDYLDAALARIDRFRNQLSAANIALPAAYRGKRSGHQPPTCDEQVEAALQESTFADHVGLGKCRNY